MDLRNGGESAAIDIANADLRGVDLCSADLVGAKLTGTRFDFASLAGAILRSAELQGASFVDADLSAADLSDANLRDVNLMGARMEGATLVNADLRGALLVGVHGQPASVAGMQLDHAAVERSGLSDEELIELHNEGAQIVDLELFSARVQEACEDPQPGTAASPNGRTLAHMERDIRGMLLEGDGPPVSLRRADSLMRMVGLGSLTSIPPIRLSAPPPSLVDGFARLSILPLVTPDTIPPASESKDPAEFEAGTVMMGITMLSRVGHGNVCEVWRGINEQDGSEVVVKLLNRDRLEAGLSAAAFRRGVKSMVELARADGAPAALAQIRIASDNRLAFVAPWAPSSCRDKRLRSWPHDRLLQLFEKVCEAVSFAHDHGILHRNIKPSNVLLDTDDEPLLTDFDIADLQLHFDAEVSDGSYRLYAAPEELIGAGTQSPSADTYSLGRLLFFLLSGIDPPLASRDDLLVEGLRGVPIGLLRVVQRATSLEPTQRYPQVQDLLAAIARHMELETLNADEWRQLRSLVPAARSMLPKQRPWLAGKAKKPPAAAGAPVAVADEWLSPKLEKGLAGGGLALIVLAVLWLSVTPIPSEIMVQRCHLIMMVGAAGLPFAIPSLQLTRARATRIAAAIGAVAAMWLIGAGPIVKARLARTLKNTDANQRSIAAGRLLDLGYRSFKGAQLSHTQLGGLDLTATDLRGAQLNEADLSGAALMDSLFDGASLTNVNAIGANFSASNPQDAKDWGTVICDETTLMPKSWYCVDGRPTDDHRAADAATP